MGPGDCYQEHLLTGRKGYVERAGMRNQKPYPDKMKEEKSRLLREPTKKYLKLEGILAL